VSRKKLSLIVPLILMFLIQALPAQAASKFNRVIFPVTVVDDSGYQFKMKKKPEKIISTMPGITEMLFSIKMGDKIVGVTDFCDYPEEAKKIQRIGKTKMNLEKVVSLEADIIFMDGDAQQKDIELFRKFNLPVFVLNPRTLDDLFITYNKMGIVTGNSHAAYRTTEWMMRKIRWIEAQSRQYTMKKTMEGTVEVTIWLKPVTAMVVVSKRPIVAAGEGTFIDDLLKIIGVKNVVGKGERYPRLGKEQILKLNPEAIIAVSGTYRRPEDVCRDGNFKHTSAGISKEALIIDSDIISRPGPRLVTALDKIYKFIYNVTATEEADEKD